MTPEKLSVLPEVVQWPANAETQQHLVDRATEILRRGGLVVFPTDTVYGIAASPLDAEAVERIFAVKQRPAEKRIALLVSDATDIGQLASVVPTAARRLAEAAWPGALTIVLPTSHADLGPTVALRLPDHEIPVRIARALGSPLATTSANISSEPSPKSAQDVLSQLTQGYDLLIDGGVVTGGVDSTVIDFSTEPPKLLRRGALSQTIIENELGAEEAARLLSP